MNRIRIFLIKIFKFKTFLAHIYIFNIVANMVLTLPWIMPQRIPVGETRQPPEGESPNRVHLWYDGSNDSLWVHPSEFINIPPKYPASNTSTNLQTPEGGVPITVSPSGCLVGVDGIWLNSRAVPTRSVNSEGVRDSHRELFIP